MCSSNINVFEFEASERRFLRLECGCGHGPDQFTQRLSFRFDHLDKIRQILLEIPLLHRLQAQRSHLDIVSLSGFTVHLAPPCPAALAGSGPKDMSGGSGSSPRPRLALVLRHRCACVSICNLDISCPAWPRFGCNAGRKFDLRGELAS
ncbi:uncharacterized protein LOC101851313 isoform X5 [Aplysia californica]|uniref:Uncharacterized protein LOC101851313 isoform X5 n=1 Tax=Aplysia californica TaxID=6500 RepID=A0ABM0JBN0_APLCA|nr:uncharacterized protein LOC101851313 isoform X5 [Aplysia californica]